MLFIALYIIITLIVMFIAYRKEKEKGALFAIGYTSAMFFLPFLLLISLAWRPTAEFKPVKKSNLIAVADDSSIRGNFLVFGTKSEYQYYRESKDGGFVQGSVPIEDTTIYEDVPEGSGYVVTMTDSTCGFWKPIRPIECRRDKYEIHIPPGSIVRDYKLDLDD